MNSLIAEKIKVADFLEMDVEPGFIYELINGEVEILSPSTMKHDRGDKMKIYRQHQVREYWIVDPKNQSIEVYQHQNNDYDLVSFAVEEGEITSPVLEGFSLNVKELFGS
ncbi:MAG: Uma2 family endonuclease [Tunicatimonas sp.]